MDCIFYIVTSIFLLHIMYRKIKVKGKVIHRPSVAQRVGRDIALLCHDRGTRRG